MLQSRVSLRNTPGTPGLAEETRWTPVRGQTENSRTQKQWQWHRGQDCNKSGRWGGVSEATGCCPQRALESDRLGPESQLTTTCQLSDLGQLKSPLSASVPSSETWRFSRDLPGGWFNGTEWTKSQHSPGMQEVLNKCSFHFAFWGAQTVNVSPTFLEG